MTKAVRPLTVERGDWAEHAAPSIDPSLWTAVIPAAGKGSRLGYDRPKILFPVGGRPILEWLLDLLLPACRSIVLVLSPEGREPVEAEIERLGADRCRIAIQSSPTGMGDAVEVGVREAATPCTAVLWGDQVAVRPASLDAVFRLHQGPLAPDLTVPTVMRDAPYIHFERDANGSIVRLLQAREGDSLPSNGESDTGFFCFRTNVLRELLSAMRGAEESMGRQTGEFNLLPVIPFAAAGGYYVLSPRVMDFEETIGINSRADVERLAHFLRRTS